MDEFIGIDWDLPARQKPGSASFDYRPRAVEAWLQDLPVTNVRETSRQLHEALIAVNGLQIKAPARLEFLERVRQSVHTTVALLRQHYLTREFPLQPQQRRIEELSLTLLQTLATGYRIVIQAALRNEARLLARRLALAVDRALSSTAAGVLEGFLVYQPAPAAQWRLLHQLYRLAEARKLTALPVADPRLRYRKQGSIADSYKQILLLSAAGPHRMRQDDIQQLHDLLERWAPAAELLAEDTRGDGIFAVDLDADGLPVPAAVTPDSGGAHRRVLHTAGMLELMRAELAEPPSWQFWRRPSPAASHPHLVHRAMLALGVVPQRRFRRSDSSSPAEVVLGLGRIHRSLAQLQGVAMEPQTSRFAARDVQNEDEHQDRDIWELIYPSDLLDEPAEPEPERADRAATGGHPCRLLNISAGGYCLLSDPAQSARAQVGELVVIRELDGQQPASWQTGVIRWMKQVPGAGLQMGVQVLAPSPAAVLLRAEQSDGRFGPEERGLLLPEILATEQPVSLISPCLHFTSGRRARVKGMGTESVLRLGRQLEATGSFAQFEFRTAVDTADTAAQFESAWPSP